MRISKHGQPTVPYTRSIWSCLNVYIQLGFLHTLHVCHYLCNVQTNTCTRHEPKEKSQLQSCKANRKGHFASAHQQVAVAASCALSRNDLHKTLCRPLPVVSYGAAYHTNKICTVCMYCLGQCASCYAQKDTYANGCATGFSVAAARTGCRQMHLQGGRWCSKD